MWLAHATQALRCTAVAAPPPCTTVRHQHAAGHVSACVELYYVQYFTGFTGKPGAGESKKPIPPLTLSVKSNAQKIHARIHRPV
eukprot:4256541-Prymnesium_polylepis.1